jgi:uroporphyrinogen-III synthase
MRILLLRSGAVGSEDAQPMDVTVLHTHRIDPRPEGVAEALAFEAEGGTLVVSSKETIRFLLPLFRAPFARMLAVGEGTGEFLRRVITGGSGARSTGAASNGGSSPIVVPEIPGAAGVVLFFKGSPSCEGTRILWPHGSDAAPDAFGEIRSLGAELVAPVVYEKHPFAFDELNPSILSDFCAGRFSAVAVGSIAGLDVLLAAVRARGVAIPNVRWGALGAASAAAVTARGLSDPLVPEHARLADLLELLRKEIR